MNREHFQQEFKIGDKFLFNDPEEYDDVFRMSGKILQLEEMNNSHVFMRGDNCSLYYPYEALNQYLTPLGNKVK